jgi:hypothetical protein
MKRTIAFPPPRPSQADSVVSRMLLATKLLTRGNRSHLVGLLTEVNRPVRDAARLRALLVEALRAELVEAGSDAERAELEGDLARLDVP